MINYKCKQHTHTQHTHFKFEKLLKEKEGKKSFN